MADLSAARKAARAGAGVITANLLRDGAVVWRDAEGGWRREFAAGCVVDAQALEAALEAARADERRQIVVGVYAAPVDAARGVPAGWKERIRAGGPTSEGDGM